MTGINPRQEWATPPEFFEVVNDEFRFDIDVCANPGNAKCSLYITPEQDGLGVLPWLGGGVLGLKANGLDDPRAAWCNPGFGNVTPWLEKAREQARDHGGTVCVLTHVATATKWWAKSVAEAREIRLLSPRVQFLPPAGVAKTSNPRDAALHIFDSAPNSVQEQRGARIWTWRWKK